MNQDINCPCKRKTCKYHLKCDECRVSHAGKTKLLICEREPKGVKGGIQNGETGK